MDFIEIKAKCTSHLKKLTCKGTLRHVFICPRSLPLTHCIHVYCILIHTGKEPGELTREKARRATVH
jgi:hypothetical protein